MLTNVVLGIVVLVVESKVLFVVLELVVVVSDLVVVAPTSTHPIISPSHPTPLFFSRHWDEHAELASDVHVCC